MIQNFSQKSHRSLTYLTRKKVPISINFAIQLTLKDIYICYSGGKPSS